MDSAGTQFAVEATPELQRVPAITARQRWFELGLVVLFAIAPITLSAVAAMFHPATGTRLGLGFSSASRFLQEGSSLLLVIYFLSRRGGSLRTIGLGWQRFDVLKGLGLAFAGLLLSACLHSFVRSLSLGLTGHQPDMRDPRAIFGGIAPGLMVAYSISAAIFEETIVRAYVTSELIALACPVWLATMTSIVLQTSYHVYYGLGGALGLSGAFIVSGIYFARSRRLLPVILGHLFMDLFAVWVNHPR